MSKIETLVKNGEQIAPRTTTKAVIDEENNTLNDILDDIESEVYEITPFIATYGVTTFAEIYAAYTDGRDVKLIYTDESGEKNIYKLTEVQEGEYSVGDRCCFFSKVNHYFEVMYIRLKENGNVWQINSRTVQSIPSITGNVGKFLSAGESGYVWSDYAVQFEEWTFTLDDGTTVTKKVVCS